MTSKEFAAIVADEIVNSVKVGDQLAELPTVRGNTITFYMQDGSIFVVSVSKGE